MNNPCTSKPCSRSSHAATDESTPPDMPTMTRGGEDMAGERRKDNSWDAQNTVPDGTRLRWLLARGFGVLQKVRN